MSWGPQIRSDVTYEAIRVEHAGDCLRVTLNRPNELNAITKQMAGELLHLFSDLYWRRDVRLVLLTGAGRAFCAGLDVKEPRDDVRPGIVGTTLDSQRRIAEIVIAMRRCPQPIIAMVNGAASGGGFALVLASDIRIGTPTTRMNAAFIRLGLSACDIGVSYFLPRMVGASVAAEYMLTGRFMDAARAHALGLFASVVAAEELEREAQTFVDDMLRASPLGLRLTKDALNHAVDAGSLEAVIAMEDRNQVLSVQDVNHKEGIAAFLEKRPPNFTKPE